jgi:hypothetical protein
MNKDYLTGAVAKGIPRSHAILKQVPPNFLLAVVTASGSVNPLENLEERALAAAPTLGEAQTVAMEKARLIRDSGNGLARFQTEITFTFTTKEV